MIGQGLSFFGFCALVCSSFQDQCNHYGRFNDLSGYFYWYTLTLNPMRFYLFHWNYKSWCCFLLQTQVRLLIGPHFHVFIFTVLNFMAWKFFIPSTTFENPEAFVFRNPPSFKILVNVERTPECLYKYIPLEIRPHACYFGRALWKEWRSRNQL